MTEKQLSIHLTLFETLHKAVKARAFKDRLSIVGLTRRALRQYLAMQKDYDPLVPEGFYPIEAYMNDKGKVVLLGDPKHDYPHSCDERGCSSIGGHVLVQTTIENIREASQSQ
jgi:hypothetical protein